MKKKERMKLGDDDVKESLQREIKRKTKRLAVRKTVERNETAKKVVVRTEVHAKGIYFYVQNDKSDFTLHAWSTDACNSRYIIQLVRIGFPVAIDQRIVQKYEDFSIPQQSKT